MNQSSEERVPDDAPSPSMTARVLPFERPQSELQKAVQQRAQELIDRERDRDARSRPKPWRRALILVLAAVPVFLIFSAAVNFVGAMRQFHTAIFSAEPEQAPAPAETPAPSASNSGDVVILQSYGIPTEPAAPDGKSELSERPQ